MSIDQGYPSRPWDKEIDTARATVAPRPVEQMMPLPVSLRQAILSYLAQRPYMEVYELVGALQALDKDAA